VIRRSTGILASLALAALIAIGALLPAASAASERPSGGDVTITEVDTSNFPFVRVGFGADNVAGKTPDLHFFENDEELSKVSLYRGPIGSYDDERRTDLMLVFDTSLSMGQGARFEDAAIAARSLIDHARKDDQIGLATFGGEAKVVVDPTADHQQVLTAIENLQLANRTTMFDAVVKAARAFDTDAKSNRAIVLLSDGTDVGSTHDVDEAAGEALKAEAPVFAVAIRENAGEQPKDLADLGNGTGGELQTVVGTSGLDALFDDLGRRILQPYWIEYRSTSPVRSNVEFGIAKGRSSRVVASREFLAVPRSSASGAASRIEAAKPKEPLLPIPDSTIGLLLASLPFALLVFWGSWRFLDRRSTPDIIARVERYTARMSTESVIMRDGQQDSVLRKMGGPIVRLSETFLGKSAFFERTRKRAEQAAIAIKPSELFAAMVVAGGMGLVVGLMFGNVLMLIACPVVFGFMPNFWLRMKARKRRAMFDDQLADVLQGISSSLKAGHAFNQAINAMIKDAPNPTAEEFARVMTEARLGMPIEDALQHMADRMGSKDFEFAVTTVNIQRTVGGSLADILEMVGDTVRNRQQFRKKVKALTSMGQMSAYVLIGMPIFIGAVISLMNPKYMEPLFTTSAGHMMMGVGAFSMVLGYVACMKVVSIKV
jgi:tight adherence protein B